MAGGSGRQERNISRWAARVIAMYSLRAFASCWAAAASVAGRWARPGKEVLDAEQEHDGAFQAGCGAHVGQAQVVVGTAGRRPFLLLGVVQPPDGRGGEPLGELPVEVFLRDPVAVDEQHGAQRSCRRCASIITSLLARSTLSWGEAV